jgi:hypothetical protein
MDRMFRIKNFRVEISVPDLLLILNILSIHVNSLSYFCA